MKRYLLLVSTLVIIGLSCKVFFESNNIYHILLTLIGLTLYSFGAIKEHRRLQSDD